MRFEPPQLADSRPTNVLDEHAQQLAVALHKAREEGLLLARTEVDAALAAHEAARRQLLRVTQALAVAVEQLTARDRDDLSEIEGQAVLFGLELAEQLTGRELTSCDDELTAAIARAMNLVPDRGAIVLRVNPLDADRARSSMEQRTDLAGRLEVMADPHVERGGCITVVGPLRIDAQMGPAIDRVRSVVRP